MDSHQTQIISSEFIAPVVPSGTLLASHSVILEGDRIKALMPRDSAIEKYPGAVEIELPGHLLTPGFVNVHGHAAMTLLRGLADDREMMDWLTNWIWPVESQLVNEQFVYDGTRLAAAEMILSGTTCASDAYFFPETSARAFTDMHMRAQIATPVIMHANAWARDEDEHIRKGLAFRDSIRNNPLLNPAFAPHAPYSVTDEGFERIRLYAEQLDIPIQLHLHETAGEVADAVREENLRPIGRMHRLGIISEALQAVHMTQLRDDEIELLAVSGAQVAHCPESNLKLASGICPVQKLRDRGVNVALGTDGAASNNDLDLIQEARTASLLSKGAHGDATSLAADELLEMMTLSGARFLGLEDEIGSIEPGKQADLTAVDLRDLNFQPLYNPVSQLIYTATGRDVTNVWINGQHLLKDREFTQVDAKGIIAATGQWQEKIKQVIN